MHFVIFPTSHHNHRTIEIKSNSIQRTNFLHSKMNNTLKLKLSKDCRFNPILEIPKSTFKKPLTTTKPQALQEKINNFFKETKFYDVKPPQKMEEEEPYQESEPEYESDYEYEYDPKQAFEDAFNDYCERMSEMTREDWKIHRASVKYLIQTEQRYMIYDLLPKRPQMKDFVCDNKNI